MSADRPALTKSAPRLRSAQLLAAALGVGLLLSALGSRPAPAQSAATEAGSIFSPAADADPRSARFRRGGSSQRPDGRSRFGDISGDPPASGASTTGFDSTNAPRRRFGAGARMRSGTAARSRPSATAAGQLVPVRPAPQPGRRGATTNPAVAAPPLVPAIVTPTRRRPPAAQDPYDPIGLRLGTFTLWPAIELTGGYDTNPPHGSPAHGSSLIIAAPELKVRSDWERHALTADIKGTYTAYSQTFGCCNPDGSMTGTPNSLNRPTLNSKVNGRLDVSSHNRFEAEGRVVVGTDNPGSPNIQAGLEKLPIYTMFGGTIGYVQSFNRFEISAKGGVDRRVYEQSLFTDGTTFNNDDRNYNQYAGTLRGSYELLPGVKPFVEFGIDTRIHDLPIDRTGDDRNSVGQVARAGTTFEISRKLIGEFSAGYLTRRYMDPNLSGIGGFVFNSSLIWKASALTTLTLTGKSTVDEIIVSGVSGVLRRDLGLQMDHALRRWLIGTARFGYGLDDYVGMSRQDQRYYTSFGLIYKLNPEVQLKGEYRRDWLKSTASGVDYTANSFMLGVRLQH